MDRPKSNDARFELSPREMQVLKLLCDGLSGKEIADRLKLSPKTVESHRSKITKKTGQRSLALAVRWAIRHKFIDP
jgi:DNA-binding NarL/FixJ family response regulator